MVVSATHFEEVTNGYEKTTSGLWTHKGRSDIGSARITNNLPPPANGAGMELVYVPSNAIGYVTVYNRATAVYGDLVLTGKNVQVSTLGGALSVPAGSIGTAALADGAVTTQKIAVNAAQQLLGQYQAVPTFSTASGAYVETPAQVTVTTAGGLIRLEWSVSVYGSAVGTACTVGLGWNGAAQFAVACGTATGVNQPFPLSGVFYTGPPASTYRFALFFAVSGGTVSIFGSTYTLLYVTEQKR